MISDDIAIVGAACRLPGGADDLNTYWHLLDREICAVSEVPEERWSKSAFYSPDRHAPGTSYSWAAGVIDGVDLFDPGFFGLSPREASQIDPQQRLALELAVLALDDAGIGLDRIRGSDTGVFVGLSNKDYSDLRIGDPASADAYFMTGTASSIVANRISYAFDLHGPSYVVDTACSSSLVAFDAAYRALRTAATDLAIVGGVNLLLSPFPFIGFSRAGMLSRQGRCRPFDAAGDGYVRAEGGGFVVLKPLARALADGDRIRAVVKGAATNADGRTAGLSLPSAETQAALLRRLYGREGLDAERLAYVEAHGTGTAVGDPAEARSIGTALAVRRSEPLPIGSSKGNVGHLEPASGMAGLIKALLIFEHGKIPASLFFDHPNPTIDFDRLNVRVAATAEPLAVPCADALIGINSFGFGGTNAHVVLQGPPEAAVGRGRARGRRLPPLVLSSHSASTLDAERRALGQRLAGATTGDAYDVAWTTACRRRHERHRWWCPGGSIEEVVSALEAAGGSENGGRTGEAIAAAPRVVFAFAGNGSQWAGMGRLLLQADPVFRKTVDRIDAVLAHLGGVQTAQLMAAADADAIAATECAQPLLFALQMGLVARLEALGLRPDVVLGHSVGEVAAACAAGALSLSDATTVIHHRSRAQALTRGRGRMLAVGGSLDAVRAAMAAVGSDVELAAFNSDRDFTLAGAEEQLRAVAATMDTAAAYAKLLELDYAFHSRAMEPIAADVTSALATLAPRRPKIRMVSAVSGEDVAGAELDADYWWRNIREPVRFGAALGSALDEAAVVVEIGPRPILTGYVRAVGERLGASVACVRGLTPEADGPGAAAALTGEAFLRGAAVTWSRQFPRPGRVAALPQRAFDRERFWFEPSGRGYQLADRGAGCPLLGHRVLGYENRFEGELDLALMPWLADHKVGDGVLLPASGFLELALAAARAVYGAAADGHALALRNLHILRPLAIEPDKVGRLRVDVAPGDGRLTIAAAPAADPSAFAVHAVARIERIEASAPELGAEPVAARSESMAAFYERASDRGLNYGPAFRRLEALTLDGTTVSGHLSAAVEPDFVLSPTGVDAAFQALLAFLPDERGPAFLPVAVGGLERFGDAAPAGFRVDVTRVHRRSIVADIMWCDERGEVVARARHCRFQMAAGLVGETARPSRLSTVWRGRSLRTGDRTGVPDHRTLVDAGRSALDGAFTATRQRMRDEIGPLLAAAAAGYARRVLAPALADSPAADIDEVAARLGAAATARPLLRRLLSILEEDGVIERSAGVWRLLDPSRLPEPEPILRAVIADTPEHAVDALLLARAGADLGLKLTGDHAPDAADDELLESPAFDHWQVGAPVVDVSRAVVLDGLRAWLGAWPEDRPLRLLNVSLGDVTLARDLERLLPAGPVHLVHAALTAKARAMLEPLAPGRPVVEVRLAEGEPVAGGDFDLIVANHVMFMTGDDEEALRSLHASLAANGLLVLGERQNDRLGDMLFAGHPRWWRPNAQSPLQPRLGHAPHWVAALEANGFSAVDALEDLDDLQPGESFHLVAARGLATPRMRTGGAERSLDLGALPSDLRPLVESALDSAGLIAATAADASEQVLWFEPLVADGLVSERATSGIRELLARLARVPSGATAWLVFANRRRAAGSLPTDPVDAALWGAVRVVANERSDVHLRLIELRGFTDRTAVAGALAREIVAAEAGEDEVVLEPDRRLVPRVVDVEASARPEAAGPAMLDMAAAGSLQRLVWRPLDRRAPAADEVEIRVAATGLNFRDVMLALGLLGDEAVEDGFAGPTLGMECAGTVTRIGDQVRDFAVGDRVVAFASSCFATHVTTATTAVAPLPAAVSMEAAATVPTVFFSAYYALKHIARLRPGEVVLIHGAAGGVGLAAIQIVHALGGDVIVTAGSEEKRDFLRLLGLNQVSTSRSLRFVEDVEAFTGGVDVVLNALAGPAIEKSLALLRPFGRFLELGKRDLYADSPIGLRPFRRNLSYFGIDADQVIAQQPDLARELFREVLQLMGDGALRPIPYRAFGSASVIEAFALMQSARHIGKIVVRLDPSPVTVPRPSAEPSRFRARNDAWYVVSGGTKGFGFETVRWLVDCGARRVALFGRSTVSADAAELVAEWRDAGLDVEVFALDVTDAAGVADRFATLRESAPIRGVFHTAAVFDDAAWTAMDETRLARVLAPKLDGAVTLADASADDALDHFVVYSSATTVFGNPGQVNYVAANLALERFVEDRRERGLPGLAVIWGPIADAGYLMRDETVKQVLETRFGRRRLTARVALDALGELLSERSAPLPADRVVAHIDWTVARTLPALRRSERFAELRDVRGETAGHHGSEGALVDRLAARSYDEAAAMVADELAALIAKILRIPRERVVPDTALIDLGLDSLMGVELSLLAQQELGIDLPLSGLSAGATLDELVERVLSQVYDGGSGTAAIRTILEQHGAEAEMAKLDGLVAADRAPGTPSKVSLSS